MFKIESLSSTTNKQQNQIDHLLHQMDGLSCRLKSDLDKHQPNSGKSTDDGHLTGESLAEEDFNQQRVGSAEFTSQSSSDESNESSSSDDSRSEDEEPALSHSFRQINQRGSSTINRSFKPKNKEDLFLNSLDVDRFTPKKLFGKFVLLFCMYKSFQKL